MYVIAIASPSPEGWTIHRIEIVCIQHQPFNLYKTAREESFGFLYTSLVITHAGNLINPTHPLLTHPQSSLTSTLNTCSSRGCWGGYIAPTISYWNRAKLTIISAPSPTTCCTTVSIWSHAGMDLRGVGRRGGWGTAPPSPHWGRIRPQCHTPCRCKILAPPLARVFPFSATEFMTSFIGFHRWIYNIDFSTLMVLFGTMSLTSQNANSNNNNNESC